MSSTAPVAAAGAPPRKRKRSQLRRSAASHPVSAQSALAVLPLPLLLPTPAAAADAEEHELEALLFGADAARLFDAATPPERQQPFETPAVGDNSRPAFVIDRHGDSSAGRSLVHQQRNDEEEEEEAAQLPRQKSTSFSSSLSTVASSSPAPVWHDPDDSHQLIDLSSSARLKKLKRSEQEKTISAVELQRRLRTLHQNLNYSSSWAASSSSDASVSSSSASMRLQGFLRSDAGVLKKVREQEALPSGHLAIKPLRDANFAEPAQGVIHSVEFHPRAPLLLTAGTDATLRLFHISSTSSATFASTSSSNEDNPKLFGLKFSDLPIHQASFLRDGREILLTGRRKFFYSFDVESETVSRIPYLKGCHEKSWESYAAPRASSASSSSNPAFSASSSSSLLAFLGDAGHIALVAADTKQWVASLKMNGTVRAAAFGSAHSLLTYGSDGDVYKFDLRTRRCLARAHDFGSHHGACLNASTDGSLLATGGDSGIVNLHQTQRLFSASQHAVDDGVGPEPLKTIDSLRNPIDVLQFNASDELLLMSSRRTTDALSLFHVPSLTSVANWPTSQTPLHYASSAAFSAHGGLLAIGNDRGRVLLYRLKHYDV